MSLRDRVGVIAKFISLAQYCFETKNFNTALEVVSALNMAPIQRLKQTWKQLHKKHEVLHEHWRKLRDIFSPRMNYIKYRLHLDTIRTLPTLPYAGLLISDLVITDSTQPSFVDKERGILNVKKMKLMMESIGEILRYQLSEYDYDSKLNVQKLLVDATTYLVILPQVRCVMRLRLVSKFAFFVLFFVFVFCL